MEREEHKSEEGRLGVLDYDYDEVYKGKEGWRP